MFDHLLLVESFMNYPLLLIYRILTTNSGIESRRIGIFTVLKNVISQPQAYKLFY
jgi:hypothetical protein